MPGSPSRRRLLPLLLFACALLLPERALAERERRVSVLLLGSPSVPVEHTLRQELGRRQLQVVRPAPYERDAIDRVAAEQLRTVKQTTEVLERAQRLFYDARPTEAADLLQRQARDAARTLALVRRFDLLRSLSLWEGVCRAKTDQTEQRAAARQAFTAAILIDPQRPDETRFPPEVLALFDDARRAVAAMPRSELALAVSPRWTDVVVDGHQLPRGQGKILLAPGAHWVVASALGHAPAVRLVQIPAANKTSPIALELSLLPANRALIIGQLEALRARGALDAGRPEVASALGRVQGADEALIVGERRSAGSVELSLTRLRCLDGRLLGRQQAKGPAAQVADATRRTLAQLYPSMPASARSKPLYRRWWFWTAIGVALAGGTVALIAATTADDSPESYVFRVVP